MQDRYLHENFIKGSLHGPPILETVSFNIASVGFEGDIHYVYKLGFSQDGVESANEFLVTDYDGPYNFEITKPRISTMELNYISDGSLILQGPVLINDQEIPAKLDLVASNLSYTDPVTF